MNTKTIEIETAVLDQAAALLRTVGEGTDPAGGRPTSGFASTRVQASAEGVLDMLGAGARVVASGVSDTERRVRAASSRWRAQDSALGGAR